MAPHLLVYYDVSRWCGGLKASYLIGTSVVGACMLTAAVLTRLSHTEGSGPDNRCLMLLIMGCGSHGQRTQTSLE